MLNLLLLFITACGVCSAGTKRPNIVLILTDDQDVVLGGMTPMQNVQKFIGNQGETYTNSYTTSPICCPSRSSILTGLYVHNHRTVNNSFGGGCYGETWLKHEENTFANLLHKDGYSTFYAGKYLNQYGIKEAGGPERVPPGWSEWHGLVGNSVYYNYTLSNDGVPTHSSDLYLTDIIRELSIRFIENQTEARPFLMMLAPPAPHAPFTPAPRHKGKFSNVTAVRNPNFNVTAKDKHWLMQMPPSPLPASMRTSLDEIYRSRWEALLAVDEMVADVVDALDTHSLLENTYLIYTSDNGYHVGQFSQVNDKRQPYESDIKVPLLISGPGVSKNVQRDEPVLNIDLAPTILKLAGLTPPVTMDGRAIDFEQEVDKKERNMLIEYHGEGSPGSVSTDCKWSYDSKNLAECSPKYACKCQDSKNNTYACIRHIGHRINMKFCKFFDNQAFLEVYDLSRDPYELTNVAEQTMPAIKHWYYMLLGRMVECRGAAECDRPLLDA